MTSKPNQGKPGAKKKKEKEKKKTRKRARIYCQSYSTEAAYNPYIALVNICNCICNIQLEMFLNKKREKQNLTFVNNTLYH